MAEVASAFVSLLPSAKGFGKKLDSEISGDIKNSGKRLGSGFGKMFAVAGGALAAAGVGSFMKSAVSESSEAQQSIGATESIFKKYADSVIESSKGAAQQYGLSANDYRESANLIGSLFKNQGVELDELGGKTDTMIGRAADLSAMFGGTTAEAVESLGSAFKGEFNPLEKFGITLNQSAINAELAARGQDKLEGSAMAAAKQQATMDLIMRQSNDSMGTFADESSTLAGQQQRLSAQWTDMKATLGTKLLPVLTTFAEYINGTVFPAISDLAPKIRDVAQASWEKFKDGISALSDLTGVDFSDVKALFTDLKDLAQTSWGKLQSGMDAIEGLTKLDGGELGKKLGEAISDALESLLSLAGTASESLGKMFAKVDWVGLGISIGKYVPALLLGLAAGILNFDIGNLMRGIGDHWVSVLLGILTIAFAPAKLLAPVTKIISKIPFVGPLIARALTWINELGGKFTKFGGDLVRTFWRGFNKVPLPGSGFIARVLGAIKSLPGKVGEFFSTLQTRIGVWALDAFEAMGKGARTATTNLTRFVGSIPGRILSALGNLARTLFPRGMELLDGMATGIVKRFGEVTTYLKGIPARITAAVGNLGSTLYNAGSQLMQGLAAGIQAKINDAINAVQAGLSKIKGMLPGSPIKWGPLKNWNNGGAGKRLMDLVSKGIEKGTPKAVEAAEGAFGKIGDALKKTRDDLQSTLEGLKKDFASLADSVANSFTGDLFGVTATDAVAAVFETVKGKQVQTEAAIAGRTVGQNFIDNLMGKRASLTGLLASFKTLQGWGIDPGFLSQLFASGNGGLITELAGMGQTGAMDTASLFGEVNALGAQLGNAVAANDPISDRIDQTNVLLTTVTKQLSYLGSDIGQELNQAAAKAKRHGKKGKK